MVDDPGPTGPNREGEPIWESAHQDHYLFLIIAWEALGVPPASGAILSKITNREHPGRLTDQGGASRTRMRPFGR